MHTHASIVPLIGGETIAQQYEFDDTRPQYILSFSPFQNNDSHLLNYYNHEVPYFLLDQGQKHPHRVDVVNTVCPCAGLSSLSQTAKSDSVMNEWMYRSAEYVLENVQPRVLWGENAPRLSSKLGEPVVDRLRKIGQKSGYTFSIFRTASRLHGLSQVRERTFYFFWKEKGRVPLLEYTNKLTVPERIEDTIDLAKLACNNDPMSQILTNEKVPSQDPYYRYLLEEIHDGISHRKYATSLTRTANVLRAIEASGHDYMRVSEWMAQNGFLKLAERCKSMHLKLGMGGNIMRKQIEVPCDVIGAFVGHMPTLLTHHRYDRFLNVREVLSIMKMPIDFQLLNPRRNLNHVCQNVPVTTARWPARMVRKYLEGKLDFMNTDFAIQDNHHDRVQTGDSPLETFFA